MKVQSAFFSFRFALLLAVALFTLVDSGCRKAQSSESSSDTKMQTLSQDEYITVAVKEKIATDDIVKASNIEVRTEQGSVTLRGIVSNNSEVETAMELAWTVPGVRDVQSEMIVVREEGGS